MVRPLFALLGVLVIIAGWLTFVAYEVNWDPARAVHSTALTAEQAGLRGLAAQAGLWAVELHRRELQNHDREAPAGRARLEHIIEIRMWVARLLLQGGSVEAAEAVAADALRADFTNKAAFALLQEIRLAGTDRDTARRTLILSLLEQEHPDVLVVLGKAFLGEGSLDDAQACFDRALHISPEHSRAHLGTARVAVARDDRSGAMQALAKAAQNPVDTYTASEIRQLSDRITLAPRQPWEAAWQWLSGYYPALCVAAGYLVFVFSPLWLAPLHRRREVACKC